MRERHAVATSTENLEQSLIQELGLDGEGENTDQDGQNLQGASNERLGLCGKIRLGFTKFFGHS